MDNITLLSLISNSIIDLQLTTFQGEWSPLETGPSRADSFEYVMHGKIYRFSGSFINNYSQAQDQVTFLLLVLESRAMKPVRELAASQHTSPLAAFS